MNYWRCKCGKQACYESGMPPRDCQGCEKCGTTFALSPDGHQPLAPHRLVPRYSRDTGQFTHWECEVCLEKMTVHSHSNEA